MNYFSEKEQSCPCCGLNKVNEHPSFLAALNTVREIVGQSLIATSMTRCAKHNKEIGGVIKSAHLKGLAADISCTTMKLRGKIVKAAYAAGFDRIEVSSVHVHLDMDDTKERDVLMLKIGKKII